MNSAFDRTRRWLAQFGAQPDALGDALAHTRVELALPIPTASAEIALAMAATLLLRLDKAAPVLHLTVPATRVRALPRLAPGRLDEAIAREHAGFDSVARLEAGSPADPVIRLVFGTDASDGVPVMSSGWRTSIGQSLPDAPGNELAAAYGGVLAGVEAIKAMLAAVGIQHRSLRPWAGALSLWDYAFPGSLGPALPDTLDLDHVVFLGCGGIGSAVAWATSLLPLTGSPTLVDDDFIDVTSLNRHLTAGHPEAAARIAKVDVFANLLHRAGATVERLQSRWQELEPGQRGPHELAVVSVDHDPTRRDLQLDFPRVILNAGNSDTGLYRVTRHDFVNGACLRCIARADLRSSGPEQSWAQRLGLPLDELRPYLQRNEALPEHLLRQASITETERDQLRGVRAHKALQIVCDKFSALPEAPALSMPPLSAAPGVLLAAELVKAKLASAPALGGRYNMVAAGVLRGPHRRWLSQREKQPRCECTDPIYQRAYRRIWG